MDVLVPKVGELVGGSQREDRLDVLTRRIEEAGMPLEPYAGYLDLRKYGSVPHSGEFVSSATSGGGVSWLRRAGLLFC